MSITLSPESISLENLPAKSSRRRTVSENVESQRDVVEVQLKRQTKSVAHGMAEIPQNHLKKRAILNSFMEKQEKESELQESPKNKLKMFPFLGILLQFLAVTFYQGGSVLAKKMEINPILMIFIRDIFTASFNLPFLIHANETPFPKGKRSLVVLRGLSVGILLMAHFYAVRYLPMADTMMISSIKPVFITLLSCLFLKEACGFVEVISLCLIVGGIFLVVQPAMIFGTTSQEYTNHMLYTAIGLMLANAQGGVISVIIRYLKNMHWAPLAISTRIFGMLEMFVVCFFLGLFCVPNCGSERWFILILALNALIVQIFCILALKFEEAHVIGLVDNAASIIISVLFQVIFFSDYPNIWKILGSCLVLCSVLIMSGKKIQAQRQRR